MSDPHPSHIDTSQFSKEKRQALEVAESSRDQRETSGLAAALFAGNPDFNAIIPFAEQSATARSEGDHFLEKLKYLLDHEVDPDQIDQTGEIPPELIKKLGALGAMGIKIPKKIWWFGAVSKQLFTSSDAARAVLW